MSSSAARAGETILVVDDHAEMLAFTAEALEAQGYTVLSTVDANEALNLARTRFEPIHVLLTDIVMPAMNGRELSERVRAVRAETRVLFMSAYTAEAAHDHQVCINPGEPFLVKPFTLAELASKVRKVLDYRSAFAQRRA